LRELPLVAVVASGLLFASWARAVASPEASTPDDKPGAVQAAPAPQATGHGAHASDAAFEYNPAGKRDPFRPLALDRKTVAQTSEPLSPLQHYDIGQLRLVGLIYDSSPARAMVEDSAGLGFIVSPGTPVGQNGGVVTSIRARQVVIEEWYSDVIGERHRREIVLELPADRVEAAEGRTTEARK
jgi:type IV pilus assembly protein PilP